MSNPNESNLPRLDEWQESVNEIFPGGFTLRDEANAIVASAFRNGPLEDLHAGEWSELLENEKLSRITDEEMKALMINACEAMGKCGTICIEETIATDRHGKQSAIIRISDTGPGIAPEIQDKLTQPFFTTKDDGTGLGLNIAERIVTEHRGIISVESKPGQGAAFTVALPCKESLDEQNSGD